MISHRNVIANVLQLVTYEGVYWEKQGIMSQTLLGLLPFSHIYGLVVMAHMGPYRGDEVIVLPKFHLNSLLKAVQTFKIEQINIVPPILIQMLANQDLCRSFDLSSVRFVFTGGAPLARETIEGLLSLYPNWHIGQAYGEKPSLGTTLDLLINITGRYD